MKKKNQKRICGQMEDWWCIRLSQLTRREEGWKMDGLFKVEESTVFKPSDER